MKLMKILKIIGVYQLNEARGELGNVGVFKCKYLSKLSTKN
jgi:hypothetical protein